MKKLLTVLLLTLSFSANAGYRTVYVCDQSQNCQYITIYENNRNNQQQQQNHDSLVNLISNSGAKNFETMRQGWQPRPYRQY